MSAKKIDGKERVKWSQTLENPSEFFTQERILISYFVWCSSRSLWRAECNESILCNLFYDILHNRSYMFSYKINVLQHEGDSHYIAHNECPNSCSETIYGDRPLFNLVVRLESVRFTWIETSMTTMAGLARRIRSLYRRKRVGDSGKVFLWSSMSVN